MTLALSILAFLVFGVIIFWLDSRIGVPFQRSWYNMTHKNKLPEGIQKGFVVNASFISRFVVAFFLVAAAFLLSIKYGNLHALEYSLLGVAQLVAIIVAFYFSAKILKIVPPAVNKAAGYLDKMEKGQVNVKEDIVRTTKKVTETIKKEKAEIQEKLKPAPKGKEIPKEEKDSKKGDEDWRKGIGDFMKK